MNLSLRVRPQRQPTPKQWARTFGTVDPMETAQNWLEGRARTTFYTDAADLKTVASIAQRSDHHGTKKTIAFADAFLAGDLKLLEAKETVRMLLPFDWQANPLNDIEWPHALNRFRRYARALSKAYNYTGREKYAEYLLSIIEDWIEQNPVGTPIAWASMATSLRLIEWCWALNLLRGSKSLTSERLVRIWGSMLLQVRHLEKHPEFELSDNHLIYNVGSLQLVAATFPFLVDRRSSGWARREYLRQLKRQHRNDGMNVEQSTHYFMQVARLYIETYWLDRLAGQTDPIVEGYVLKFLENVIAMMRPDGTVPLMSDAFTSFFEESATEDAHVLLGWATVVFGRGDFKFPTNRLKEGAVWLLADRAEEFDNIEPVSPSSKSRFMEESGYFFYRDNWTDQASYCCVDAGPLGFPPVPAHGHPDLLSFEWYHRGRPVVIDPGTYEYEPGERAYYFRRTRAHATVTIDGQDQATQWGFARWVDLPGYRLLARGSFGNTFWVEAEHAGYARLDQPVLHKRRIAFVMPDVVIIEDILTGQGRHLVEQTFPLHPSWNCEIDRDGTATLTLTGQEQGVPLTLQPLVFPTGWKCDAPKGQQQPIIWGFSAANYGVCEPAHVVVFSLEADMPIRLLTVLCPNGKFSPTGTLQWEMIGENASTITIVAGDNEGFGVIERTDNRDERMISVGLTGFEPNGERAFRADASAGWISAYWDRNEWKVQAEGKYCRGSR